MKKTALITGATSGIGLELAKIHAHNGDNLVLVSRGEAKLNELKIDFEQRYNISVFVVGIDLSQAGAALDVYKKINEKGIQVDYLVNNAGFGDYGYFSEANWDKNEQMINLNITTLTYFCRLFLPNMIKQGGGKIMNVASTAAFQPGPLMSVYYATKAYVLHFSEAVGNEVKDKNITVTALCPGPTKSGFQKAAAAEESSLFKGRKMPGSKEVAIFGHKSMMKGRSVAIHGFGNRLLSCFPRFFPRAMVVKMVRQFQDKA